MRDVDKHMRPGEASKDTFIFICKLVGLAYAVSLIPFPVWLAHIMAVEGLLLWLLYSAIYTVRYRRRRNIPEATAVPEGSRPPARPSRLRPDQLPKVYVYMMTSPDSQTLGSGKEPPCLN